MIDYRIMTWCFFLATFFTWFIAFFINRDTHTWVVAGGILLWACLLYYLHGVILRVEIPFYKKWYINMQDKTPMYAEKVRNLKKEFSQKRREKNKKDRGVREERMFDEGELQELHELSEEDL